MPDNAKSKQITSQVVIRTAKPFEHKHLEDLQLRASLESQENRDALLANPDAVEIPIEQILEGRTFVAERQGEIVGFCVVLPRGDGDTELDGLFVEPTAWQSGIGTHLVQHAALAAAREGAEFLWVIANPAAQGFYAKCGFERISEAQTRFGKAITMRKALC